MPTSKPSQAMAKPKRILTIVSACLMLASFLFSAPIGSAAPMLGNALDAGMQAPRAQSEGPRPVVLVPGMGASFNGWCMLFELSCQDPDEWGFLPVQAEAVYTPLIEHLEAAGYTQENGYLRLVFYDWRQPLADNAQVLAWHIAQVKAQTGASQIDLIGHSMGGLVSRAYIQGDTYAGDVAQLITLGSPHYGAAKAYPYWEAATFYDATALESFAYSLVIHYYMARQLNPIPVYALRSAIPGMRDILPTAESYDLNQLGAGYLYNARAGDALKAESGMLHRNTALSALNADLETLYSRTQVFSLAGDGLDTPMRFFVQNRSWWEWPNWDDGKPLWSREAEFMSPAGDGTVSAASTLLPAPAQTIAFPNLDHMQIAGETEVLATIFDLLGIPLPELPVASTEAASALALVIDGPLQATVRNGQGQSLSSERSEIPGGQYFGLAGEPYQMLLLPPGRYEIEVEGNLHTNYAISLIDGISAPARVMRSLDERWDTMRSRASGAIDLRLSIEAAADDRRVPRLHAITPILESDLRAGDQTLQGRARPGAQVVLRDAVNGEVLGQTVADGQGHFQVQLAQPLRPGQRIIQSADGIAGPESRVEDATQLAPPSGR